MKARSEERYEVNKFEWMKDNLTSEDTFIDVGANKGDFTLHAAQYCKKVYSVEPHFDNIHWLKKSIELNCFSNIEVLEGCATNKNEPVELYLGAKSGHHSITRNKGQTINVNGFRLDDVITDKQLVMKIDVEGAEKLVLEGSQSILDNVRALLIDLDSRDLKGVEALLPKHTLLKKNNNDLLFVR
jgi:FkbM family methyltransferase